MCPTVKPIFSPSRRRRENKMRCGGGTTGAFTLLFVVAALTSIGDVAAFHTPFATTKVRFTVFNTKYDLGSTSDDDNGFVQYSLVKFFDENGARIPNNQISCAANPLKPVHQPQSSQSIARVCDDQLSTKMLAGKNEGSSSKGYVEVEFTFTNPYIVQGYKICTANDKVGRDPASWMLHAKLSTSTSVTGDWFLLDKRDGVSLPGTRSSCSSKYSTSFGKEVYRLEILTSRSGGNNLQLAEIDWFAKGASSKTVPDAIYSGNDKMESGDYWEEGVNKLIDNSAQSTSKWRHRSTQYADIILTYPKNLIMGGATLFSANSYQNQDPKMVKWWYLQNDRTWYKIMDQEIPDVDTRKVPFGLHNVDRYPRCACMAGFGFDMS